MIKYLVIMYLCFVIVVFVSIKIEEYNGSGFAITPKEIYECNNFNMLLSWILFIIVLFLNPLWYISKFLYWIFHVGREDI